MHLIQKDLFTITLLFINCKKKDTNVCHCDNYISFVLNHYCQSHVHSWLRQKNDMIISSYTFINLEFVRYLN